MTTNYPPGVLIEVADLCALARANIERYGHRQGFTSIGREHDLGVCIGSALAMAANMTIDGDRWDWGQWAGQDRLCPGGVVFADYAVRTGRHDMWVGRPVAAWNDSLGRTEDDALALLFECEEAMRSDATDIAVGAIWDSLGYPVTAEVA